MPSNTHSDDVTQLFNLLSNIAIKPSCADFQASEADHILRVEAHSPGVFRLRFGALKHIQPERISLRAQQYAEMLLAREDAVGEFALEEDIKTDEGWRLEQGDCTLELRHSPFSLLLRRGEDILLEVADSGVAQVPADDTGAWQIAFTLHEDEELFGLGESSTELRRRGIQVRSDKPGDRSLPLLWSTKGWGVYINTLQRVDHDVASTVSDLYQVRVEATVLDVFLFAGAPTEILNQYSALTGRAGQPGLWPMGVWLEQAPGQPTSQTFDLLRVLREAQMGLDGVALSGPALYGFSADRPLFEWDDQRIPDIRDITAKAHEQQVQLAGRTFPGVLAGTALFDEWEDRGWLLVDDDSGEAHLFAGNETTGGQPFALLDLSHKDAFRLWSERQRQVFDEGLGAPICSAEFDIPDTITARGGESGALLRTIYPILVRQALFEAFAGHKTPQEGVVLSSDLFPGAQRYSLQTGPHITNDWAGLEHTLRTALSLGNSGIAAQTHKLGNAVMPTTNMTPELYIRWLAMGVFSANFSFQGIPELLPGAFDEKTRELVAHWLQWRYRLVPYVLGIIEESVRCGLPVQRSMALEFPLDAYAHEWDTQYMLGSALLVAPFLRPGDEMEVYLPEGNAWWDLATGWRYEGVLPGQSRRAWTDSLCLDGKDTCFV